MMLKDLNAKGRLLDLSDRDGRTMTRMIQEHYDSDGISHLLGPSHEHGIELASARFSCVLFSLVGMMVNLVVSKVATVFMHCR